MLRTVPQAASAPQSARTKPVLDAVGYRVELCMLFPTIVEQRPLRKLRTVNSTDAHSQQAYRQMPMRQTCAQHLCRTLPEDFRGVCWLLELLGTRDGLKVSESNFDLHEPATKCVMAQAAGDLFGQFEQPGPQNLTIFNVSGKRGFM